MLSFRGMRAIKKENWVNCFMVRYGGSVCRSPCLGRLHLNLSLVCFFLLARQLTVPDRRASQANLNWDGPERACGTKGASAISLGD